MKSETLFQQNYWITLFGYYYSNFFLFGFYNMKHIKWKFIQWLFPISMLVWTEHGTSDAISILFAILFTESAPLQTIISSENYHILDMRRHT